MKSQLIIILYLSKVELDENTKNSKYHVQSENFGKTLKLRISPFKIFFIQDFSLGDIFFRLFE